MIEPIENNLIERALHFATLLGGEVHREDDITWFRTGPAMPRRNGIVRVDFTQGNVDSRIEMALATFRAEGLPVTWWVGPSTRPERLGWPLQEHGLRHNRTMMGLAAPIAELPDLEPPSDDLTFERVNDPDGMRAWYDVVLACFPLSYDLHYLNTLVRTIDDDLLHNYIVRREGRVVSCSTLYLGGGAAGLYNMGTVPDAREGGIGSWLTARTFAEAERMGHTVATLQTTYPNALRMYHRLGFEAYCKFGIYQFKP